MRRRSQARNKAPHSEAHHRPETHEHSSLAQKDDAAGADQQDGDETAKTRTSCLQGFNRVFYRHQLIISNPVMFALGFVCSLYFGWFALPKEQALLASGSISKAVDELLSSDTMEKLLNASSKMRVLLDAQAAKVAGRFGGMRTILPNASFGIKELFSTWQIPDLSQVLGKSERVGVRMARAGASVHSPVVMIPGIITTGLEVWDGEECIRSYFRQRIWGTSTMFQSMMSDPDCWLRHLALNATTGLDPLQRPYYNRSIRVRPAQGFESADFFLGGYWIWGLMIEALADIGYDYNSMYMASYDWRLAFADMENRDRYFTKLRQQIETLVSLNGKKAVVVAHSMGGNLWHYFMQWVTHRHGRTWVDRFVSAEVMVSAPLLGLPKAYYSMLTGDNRDFVAMGAGFSAVVDYFFGLQKRRDLWRTCSSLALIMPIGGERLWGPPVAQRPLVYLDNVSITADEAYDLLGMPKALERIAPWLREGMRRARPVKPPAASLQSGRVPPQGGAGVPFDVPEHFWANVLASPLPYAPSLRKYAFYGIGVATEHAAHLEEVGDDVETPRYGIRREATPDVGFYLGDGDYSCPTMTLGLMCIKGWLDDERNPSGTRCTSKEYHDKPTTLIAGGSFRGGPASGDHIDLLGNDELLTDVLTIASGGQVEERILSNIREIASRWDDEDGTSS